MKISLCMIVRDEEEVLARCLDSVEGLFDEIVIADTGSEDGTPDIARRYTDNVFSFRWRDDFAAARNFAFSKGTGDYLCWMDADDVLTADARALFPSLRSLLEGSPDLVYCPYLSGGLRYLRERLFRKEADFRWKGRVHECVTPRGRCLKTTVPFLHLSSGKKRGTRNLGIYETWEREEKLDGRHLFYYGRELYYDGQYRRAEQKLKEAIEGEGWYVNKIEASRVLAACLSEEGRSEEAREVLLSSLKLGEPRAGTLCDLAKLCKRVQKYGDAAFWYEAALLARDHSDEGDFEEPALHGIVPLLELVVCWWKLGDRKKAEEYHLRAKSLAPSHPSVLYNEKFFLT